MVSAIPTPPNGAELMLDALGTKYASGTKLSGTDIGNAIIATARINASNFGPGPSDMPVREEQIPESVKGALISHSS